MPKDFTITKINRTAKRTFTAPIISEETFDGIIGALTGETNPLGTTSYQTAGRTEPGVKITREDYSTRVEYVANDDGSNLGSLAVYAKTREEITSAVTEILGNTTLTGVFGDASAVENDLKASWSVTLRLHDPNGEIYNISLNRESMTLSSFESDAILGKVETWADTVPSLN